MATAVVVDGPEAVPAEAAPGVAPMVSEPVAGALVAVHPVVADPVAAASVLAARPTRLAPGSAPTSRCCPMTSQPAI